jgi:hypothetical protein
VTKEGAGRAIVVPAETITDLYAKHGQQLPAAWTCDSLRLCINAVVQPAAHSQGLLLTAEAGTYRLGPTTNKAFTLLNLCPSAQLHAWRLSATDGGIPKLTVPITVQQVCLLGSVDAAASISSASLAEWSELCCSWTDLSPAHGSSLQGAFNQDLYSVEQDKKKFPVERTRGHGSLQRKKKVFELRYARMAAKLHTCTSWWYALAGTAILYAVLKLPMLSHGSCPCYLCARMAKEPLVTFGLFKGKDRQITIKLTIMIERDKALLPILLPAAIIVSRLAGSWS